MIEIGQDGTGRWAWMIKAANGRVLASKDDYPSGEMALEEAIAHARRAGLDSAGMVCWR